MAEMKFARDFITTYYPVFINKRGELTKFFAPDGQLILNGKSTCKGPEAISKGLAELKMKLALNVDGCTCTSVQGITLLSVWGKLKIDDNEHAVLFEDAFVLVKNRIQQAHFRIVGV